MVAERYTRRFLLECQLLIETPEDWFIARPFYDNIYEWMFLFKGNNDTVYKNGNYIGRLVLSADHPFNPPIIEMNTPNGRFPINKNLYSDLFHSWNPGFMIQTYLFILISVFNGNQIGPSLSNYFTKVGEIYPIHLRGDKVMSKIIDLSNSSFQGLTDSDEIKSKLAIRSLLAFSSIGFNNNQLEYKELFLDNKLFKSNLYKSCENVLNQEELSEKNSTYKFIQKFIQKKKTIRKILDSSKLPTDIIVKIITAAYGTRGVTQVEINKATRLANTHDFIINSQIMYRRSWARGLAGSL